MGRGLRRVAEGQGGDLERRGGARALLQGLRGRGRQVGGAAQSGFRLLSSIPAHQHNKSSLCPPSVW